MPGRMVRPGRRAQQGRREATSLHGGNVGAGLWAGPEHVGTAVFKGRRDKCSRGCGQVGTDARPAWERRGVPQKSSREPPRGPEARLLRACAPKAWVQGLSAVPPTTPAAARTRAQRWEQPHVGGRTEEQHRVPPRDGLLSSLREEGAGAGGAQGLGAQGDQPLPAAQAPGTPRTRGCPGSQIRGDRKGRGGRHRSGASVSWGQTSVWEMERPGDGRWGRAHDSVLCCTPRALSGNSANFT